MTPYFAELTLKGRQAQVATRPPPPSTGTSRYILGTSSPWYRQQCLRVEDACRYAKGVVVSANMAPGKGSHELGGVGCGVQGAGCRAQTLNPKPQTLYPKP